MRAIKEAKVISRVRRKTNTRKTVFILLAVFAFQFLAVMGLITFGGKSDPEAQTEYLIILGAQLHGETPSKALYQRLDAGIAYLRKYPDTIVIVSGGQGKGEDIAEAEAMYRYLAANGIDENRMIREARSSSTMENFMFSRRLIEQRDGSITGEITFVTNDYHIFRSRMLAKRNGLKVRALAAGSSGTPVSAYLREYLAFYKSLLFDR
ncbi:MAG: YdcF family protein [Clostridiaceae bacterium]|nr:YdcF family protein [Clostridiaceae bacterium]